jgi:hypothetical protein
MGTYRNPDQFITTRISPIAEGLKEGFSKMIAEDRLKQAKIQKREDEITIALGNNLGKLPSSNNPALKNSFAGALAADADELRGLSRELSSLTGEARATNLLRQTEIKGNVEKYGKNIVTAEFLSKKYKESMSKNPGEEGYISKSTGAPLLELLSAYNSGDDRLRLRQVGNDMYMSLEGSGYELDLNNATSIIDGGSEILKTIAPISEFQETASKTLTEPNIAGWKETVSTKIPLKDGGYRSITEEKINKEKALQQLLNNGSFDWVSKKTSYDMANQTWVDRMGENSIFDNNNPEQVMAIKKWLAEDTINNVVPQSQLIADTVTKAATKTKAEKDQVKLNSWWNKNSGDMNSKLNKAMGSGKINMKNTEEVFESYGFTVKAADIEVDGKRILNSYTITNPKYGKGWSIRIEANDSPSTALAKIAGQFTGDMEQVEAKQSLPKI